MKNSELASKLVGKTAKGITADIREISEIISRQNLKLDDFRERRRKAIFPWTRFYWDFMAGTALETIRQGQEMRKYLVNLRHAILSPDANIIVVEVNK